MKTTSPGRASVMSWDSGEQPDLDRLAEIVRDLSGGAVHLAAADTNMNEYAVVVSTVQLDQDAVQATFERWWAPENPEDDRPDILEVGQRTKYTTGGTFIVFEGGEGSGKSTQANRLCDYLTDAGSLGGRSRHVIRTRQPGGTRIGDIIRSILLNSMPGTISNRAEALLYAADRAQHVDEVVRPALEAGYTVVCDRYVDSSLAYQAAGRAMDTAKVAELSRWATDGLIPDLTVLLDIDPKIGLRRAKQRRGGVDRIEAEPLQFHQQVRDTYLQLAAADPDRYLVLDALRDPDELARTIAAHVRGLATIVTGATG